MRTKARSASQRHADHTQSHAHRIWRRCVAVTCTRDQALPAPPCETTGGTVDRAKCQRLADWIATGTITNVVHHEQGYPLLKDFAEFTLTVQTWEKGGGKVGRELRFQVGWCENSQPLPKDTSGSFRVFGLALPKDPSVPNQYLNLEPLTVTRP
jgi:hypothetical protein